MLHLDFELTHGKHEGVDEQHQDGVKKRPRHHHDRTAIALDDFTLYQRLYQAAVAP